MDLKPRQIYVIIFQKEYYPCNRFEIGNNTNKKVYICHSDKLLKELLESFKEDKCHLVYVTLHRTLMLKVKARARHAFTLKQNNLF